MISGQGIKIPHATWCGQKEKKKVNRKRDPRRPGAYRLGLRRQISHGSVRPPPSDWTKATRYPPSTWGSGATPIVCRWCRSPGAPETSGDSPPPTLRPHHFLRSSRTLGTFSALDEAGRGSREGSRPHTASPAAQPHDGSPMPRPARTISRAAS